MNRLDELKNKRNELISKNWWLVACIALFGVSGLLSGLKSGDIVSALVSIFAGVLLGAFLPYYLKSFGFSIKESFKAGVAKRDATFALFFMFGLFFVLIFKSLFWAIRDLFNLIKDFIVLTIEINKLQKEVQE